MEILKDWRFWGFAIAIISFLFSAFNFIIGKIIANNITGNELKHLTEDVSELKQESKEYKGELKTELNKIFRRLGKIEKQIVKRDVLCEERHPKR